MMLKKTNKRVFFHRNHPLTVLPRLALGGALFFSGANKLPMHSEFVNLVNSYHLLPVWMGTVYATILPWVELLIGAYLILGILIRPSAIVAALMAVSFMVANISSIIRGDDQCLSCFGEAFSLSPWQSLIIDGVIVIIAMYLMTVGHKKQFLSFDAWFGPKSHSK